jgi:hypothetical protein
MSGETGYLKLRCLGDFASFRAYPIALIHRDLTSFNPSIALHDGELYVSVRHSNVLFTGRRDRFGSTCSLGGNGRDLVNETSFGILRLPERGEALDCRIFPERARGFEDIRIFRYRDRWFGVGCLPEMGATGGGLGFKGNVMQFLSFGGDFRVEGVVPIPSPYGASWEKNWVPFCKSDSLHLVYRPSPLDILTLDFDNRRMLSAFKASAPAVEQAGASPWPDAAQHAWCGSSQIVPYENGIYLGVIHRKFIVADQIVLEHAFIRIGENFAAEISHPFHFLTYGIEFCGGLAARPVDIVLSFGSHNDSRAFVATLGRDAVAELFEAA